ncbi:MAG: helix-turn-helix transcriptional regulator [Lachnospiraceae bacterium]|nr:helix-turn-helix transcriptional regulator [Lachnospiraceae bacterium]
MEENECTVTDCREIEAANASHEAVIDYIGPRIKELCEKRHMTRYRLAQLSGVASINITRYIEGRRIPAVSTLEKLCDGFGISMSCFFEDVGYQADPALTDEQNELLEAMDALDEDGRRNLIAYARFLAGADAS